MKKFLRVLIIVLVVLIVLPSLSLADGFDVSAMSLEELLELRNMVDIEIRTRMSTSTAALYNGTYVVGTDIKAGKHLLTVIEVTPGRHEIDRSEISWTTVTGDSDCFYLVAGESRIIELEEGTILDIYGVLSATLTDVPPASYAP